MSQEPSGTPGWSSQLLLFSGVLFLISLIVYGGITLGHKPFYENKEELLKKKISTFEQQIPLSKQEEITSFYAQLVNIRQLLQSHVTLTSFFSWIEAHAQPNVYFRTLSVDVAGGKVSFVAVAKTLADAEEQFGVFERAKEVQTAEVSSVIPLEKGVGWELTGAITFPSTFFASKPVQ